MGFLINDFLKLDIMKDAEIVAGREGLNNEIVWVNMMEILDQLDNIQSGELLLTTGYKLELENFNKDLIYKLKRKKLAGMAIQLGYYIDAIPENILKDGNFYGFPIIKVPEKITFSHVTRTIFSKIHNSSSLINSREEVNWNQLLLNMIKNKNLTFEEEHYLASSLNTKESCGYCCMILSIQHSENGFMDKLYLENTIDKLSFHLSSECLGEVHQELITEGIFLCSLKPDSDINKITQILNNLINSSYRDSKNVFIRLSISSVFSDLNKVSEAYHEASTTLECMNKSGIRKGVCYINNLNILQLLSNIEPKENFINYYQNVLKSILNFDLQHNTNYLDTLRVFLMNNCNINRASNNLFIHRHTLRYRLEKIKGICNIDFNDYNSIFTYQLAFFIQELYN